MNDPLVVLADALIEHQPPPLAWLLEWAPDGNIERAWTKSWTPSAMCEILGISLSDTAPRIPKWVAVISRCVMKSAPTKYQRLAKFMSALKATNLGYSDPLPPEALASLFLCLTVILEDMLPVRLQHVLDITPSAVAYLCRWSLKDMHTRAALIRTQHPVPPTLAELFTRFEVGAQESP
jgi:hypothetical protein